MDLKIILKDLRPSLSASSIVTYSSILRNIHQKVFGKDIVGKKCYQVYKIHKNRCIGCPIKKKIKVGQTKKVEVSGFRGDKIFSISHIGSPLKLYM